MWYFSAVGATVLGCRYTIDILRRKCCTSVKIFWGLQCEMVTLMALLTITIDSILWHAMFSRFFPQFFMLFLLCLLVAMLPYMHTLSSGNPMQWQIPCLFIDNLWFCIRMPHRLPTPLIPFSMGQNFRIYFAFSAFGVTFRCNHIRSIQKWVHWT